MSMKRSLARMVSTAMHNQQRLKQQASEGPLPEKPGTAADSKSDHPAQAKPSVPEPPKAAATPRKSTSPKARFSPPPLDIVRPAVVSPLTAQASEELSRPLSARSLSSEPAKPALGDLCVAELRRRMCEQLEREKAYESLVSELEKQRLDLQMRDQNARARIAELEAEGVRMAAWAASLRGVADRSSIEVRQLRNDVVGLKNTLDQTAGRLQRGEALRYEVLDDLSMVQKRLVSNAGDAAGSAVLVDMILEKVSSKLD